jgi:hypothetical protein
MGYEVLNGEILWIGCIIMKKWWIALSQGKEIDSYTYGLIDITISGLV